MTCPKCGHEQNPANTECAKCGIVFAKYYKLREARENKSSEDPEGAEETSGFFSSGLGDVVE